jgi:S-methylmethionine-dependent homocysteine/selenocysteine methylase
MTIHQHPLTRNGDLLFLTDSGLETTLVFHDGMDLPCFAAFDLLKDETGTDHLRRYYQQHIDLSLEYGFGFVLESVSWRASSDWGDKLGYTSDALDEAAAYHTTQIRVLSEAGADMVTALTLTNSDEAIGIVKAAQAVNIPVVISFTLETDGRLPSRQTLHDAIEAVDGDTNNGPAYYMINCAHPSHFGDVLVPNASWVTRIQGIRANASCMSHAELDNSETLDDGNPEELGHQYSAMLRHRPSPYRSHCQTMPSIISRLRLA